MVDRTEDHATIRSLLLADDVRLLTLTGPAGVGKTRLALEVGHEICTQLAHEVVFVDLSPVRDPSAVLETLAQSLDADEGAANESMPTRLAAILQDRAMLLILDNVEQILPAATYLADLLVAAPGVTMLVTSREPLHLRWEQIFRVRPLELPDPQHLPSLDELSQIPSVALFVQRARTIDSHFALSRNNARAIAELCVHLDGLPLAIELAAARTAILSPQMILERLGQRLALLHWQAQDLPGRQQTLRSAIAWSYHLLSSEEQALFRRLGTFTGSFSLEAAETIAEDTHEHASTVSALEGLASLVNKSLVQVHGSGENAVRYSLLESIRHYALEQLAEAGEQNTIGWSHAEYYLALAERAEPELTGRGHGVWFLQLEQAHENLRAAFRWFIDHGNGERALRLAAALGYFWEERGYTAEGGRRLEEALAQASSADPTLRARALSWLGTLAAWTTVEAQDGNGSRAMERAQAVLNEALELARSVPDPVTIARSLTGLGMLYLQTEAWEQSKCVLDEARSAWEAADDGWGIASSLVRLGIVELMQGHHEESARFTEEGVTRFRTVGDDSAAGLALLALMSARGARGDVRGALTLGHETLALGNETHNRRLTLLCAAGVAWLLREQGEPERLARLWGAADAKRQAMGLVRSPMFRLFAETTTETLETRIGREALAAALASGRSLSFEEMRALTGEVLTGAVRGLAPPKAAPGSGKSDLLSPREHEVLALVAQGLTDKQIAEVTIVAESTVRYHLTSIFNKLGVDSRTHALAVAVQRGLVLLNQKA